MSDSWQVLKAVFLKWGLVIAAILLLVGGDNLHIFKEVSWLILFLQVYSVSTGNGFLTYVGSSLLRYEFSKFLFL